MPFDTFSPAVQIKIETLCARGCKQVNQIIERSRKQLPIAELDGFNQEETRQILAVLTEIMAVYDNKG